MAVTFLSCACGGSLQGSAHAQSVSPAKRRASIAQFVVWKPKAGHQASFESGYQRHLEWHKANGDTWGWYGWFFTSGPRDGQFMDATLGHAWSDFDRPVNPAGDSADNERNVVPFGDFQTVHRVASLDELTIGGPAGLTSKFVRLVTLSVTDTSNALRILSKIKTDYQNNGVKSLVAYRVVDGGSLNEIQLYFGSNSREEYGKTESLAEDIDALEHQWKIDAIGAMTSETLTYRADMSLFPGK